VLSVDPDGGGESVEASEPVVATTLAELVRSLVAYCNEHEITL
jgi:hypothetical protein